VSRGGSRRLTPEAALDSPRRCWLAKHRGSKKTICPSDATRAIGGGSWRSLSTLAREVARDLASAGDVDILQRGEVLDPHAEWKGPIRIRMRST